MTIRELRHVDPLFVRSFTPTGGLEWFGGVMVWESFDVEDVGLASERLSFDEPVVDCSNRIFQITTEMMLSPARTLAWAVFPSRRWRTFRTGDRIERNPDPEHPLLYLGNPIPLYKDAAGIHVIRLDEFLIKSGPELGY